MDDTRKRIGIGEPWLGQWGAVQCDYCHGPIYDRRRVSEPGSLAFGPYGNRFHYRCLQRVEHTEDNA